MLCKNILVFARVSDLIFSTMPLIRADTLSVSPSAPNYIKVKFSHALPQVKY